MNKKIIIMPILMLLFVPFIVMGYEDVVNPNTVNYFEVLNGNHSQGTLLDLQVFEDGFIRIDEDVNGLEVIFYFEGVNGLLDELKLNARYIGGANHHVEVQIYDYNASSYVYLGQYGNNPNYAYNSYNISNENFTNNGEVRVRLYHPQDGISSHYLDVDYLIITSITTTEEVFKPLNVFDLDLDDKIIQVFLLIIIITGVILSIGMFGVKKETYGFTGSIILFFTSLVLFLNNVPVIIVLALLLSAVIGIINTE